MTQEKPEIHDYETSLSLNVVKTDFHSHAFLKAALAQCSAEHTQRFWLEFHHAIINIHASLSGDFGDEEAMIQSAEYVKFLGELGLMQLCQGQIDQGFGIIQSTSATYLIRLGRTTLVGLRKRLTRAVHNNPSLGNNFCHADSPLREVARALSLPEPRFYEGLSDPKKLTIRYFQSIADVNATLKAVNELIFRGQFVSALAGNPGEHHNLSHATLTARALVNQFVARERVFSAISIEDLGKLTNKQGQLCAEFTHAARAFGEKTAEALVDSMHGDKELITAKTSAFINAILAQLEQNPSLLLE